MTSAGAKLFVCNINQVLGGIPIDKLDWEPVHWVEAILGGNDECANSFTIRCGHDESNLGQALLAT